MAHDVCYRTIANRSNHYEPVPTSDYSGSVQLQAAIRRIIVDGDTVAIHSRYGNAGPTPLYGRELIAVGGSRIKAVNGRDQNFSEAKLNKAIAQTDERLARYLKQLDEEDIHEQQVPTSSSNSKLREKIASIRERKTWLEQHREILENSADNQVSLTDP